MVAGRYADVGGYTNSLSQSKRRQTVREIPCWLNHSEAQIPRRSRSCLVTPQHNHGIQSWAVSTSSYICMNRMSTQRRWRRNQESYYVFVDWHSNLAGEQTSTCVNITSGSLKLLILYKLCRLSPESGSNLWHRIVLHGSVVGASSGSTRSGIRWAFVRRLQPRCLSVVELT